MSVSAILLICIYVTNTAQSVNIYQLKLALYESEETLIMLQIRSCICDRKKIYVEGFQLRGTKNNSWLL